MSTLSFFKTTLVLSVLFGGATILGASVTAQAKKKRAPAASSTADCKTDRDCVAVIDDCCPCNQGGKQRAIPRKEKDTYEKDRKKRCAGQMCTEMMSEDPSCQQVPFCGAGICELGDPPPAK